MSATDPDTISSASPPRVETASPTEYYNLPSQFGSLPPPPPRFFDSQSVNAVFRDAVAHTQSSGSGSGTVDFTNGPGVGGGRKASVSLQLFKETARVDDDEKREKTRLRTLTTSMAGGTGGVLPVVASKKGKEREWIRPESADRSPLPSPDRPVASHSAAPRSHKPISRTSTSSPRINSPSPTKASTTTTATTLSHAHSRPPSHTGSPAPSGLSHSRPVSPSPQARSTPFHRSPVPDFSLPHPALTIPSPEAPRPEAQLVSSSTDDDPAVEPSTPSPPLRILFSPKIVKDAAKRSSPSGISEDDEDIVVPKLKEVLNHTIEDQNVGRGRVDSELEDTESETASDEDTWSEEEEYEDEDEGTHAERDGEAFEYEVDVEPLREKLDSTGGGTVSMGRGGNDGSWGSSQLVDGTGRSAVTVPLEPFDHQVGGHSHIFRFSKKAVCKVS